MSKRDFVVSGIHIGEHSFEPKDVIEEINERCVKNGLNFVTIRTRKTVVPRNYLIEWAQYLTDNKIYFSFLYTVQNSPPSMKSQLDKDTVARINQIAGKYFIGDILGELGSALGCKWSGYHEKIKIPKNVQCLSDAKKSYTETVKRYVDIDKELGINDVISLDATALSKYNLDAGADIPVLELMCGNPEILVSGIRGLARAKSSKIWGTYVAHEWYGGMRHDDILKQKRLNLAYNYAYISGSNIFCLESGDEALRSYGYHYSAENEYCRQYQKTVRDFTRFTKEDSRPEGGPVVKVAFVQGNLDAWGSWGGSALWGQYGREEWGHGDAEYAWRVLEELGNKRNWYDIANFGDNDLSATPVNGMYDVIPAESSLEAMSRYDYLVFVGWNTMTDEIYSNLKQYVSNGGILFMLASHLNVSDCRKEKVKIIGNGAVEDLFGCKLIDSDFKTNAGVKFEKTSKTEKLMYPGTTSRVCDPIYSHGYAKYARVSLEGGRAAARLSESFRESGDFTDLPVAVIENRVGDGTAILLATLEHAGNGAIYPLYRAIVREIISASHREGEIKVYGSTAVRFAVYSGDVIYLLNTDYDADANVVIEKHGKVIKETLKPCQMKKIV